MIDLDELEAKCSMAISNGYGHLPVIDCGNAVKISELITRLRQAEKDAARYRWLRDDYRHEYCVDDLFDGSSAYVDNRIDEAMQCNK